MCHRQGNSRGLPFQPVVFMEPLFVLEGFLNMWLLSCCFEEGKGLKGDVQHWWSGVVEYRDQGFRARHLGCRLRIQLALGTWMFAAHGLYLQDLVFDTLRLQSLRKRILLCGYIMVYYRIL